MGAGKRQRTHWSKRRSGSRRRGRARRSSAIAGLSTVVFLAVVGTAIVLSPGWPRTRESFLNWEIAKDSLPDILLGLWLNLRVLLVSCGAEETLQDGIRAFVARHREELDPASTLFLNLDTVGSPHLVMLEGEGPIWMEEYEGPWLRDMVADTAAYLEIPLERGFRARASTDSIIPSRAGYPTAMLLSITDWRSPANYHLPSDIPANLDYRTVAQATRLVHELIGRLAADQPGEQGESVLS